MKNVMYAIFFVFAFSTFAQAAVVDKFRCETIIGTEDGEVLAKNTATMTAVRTPLNPNPNWVPGVVGTEGNIEFVLDAANIRVRAGSNLHYKHFVKYGENGKPIRASTTGCMFGSLMVDDEMGQAAACPEMDYRPPFDPTLLNSQVPIVDNIPSFGLGNNITSTTKFTSAHVPDGIVKSQCTFLGTVN